MKKIRLCLLCIIVLIGSTTLVQAQEEKAGRFNLLVNGGVPVSDFSSIVKPGLGGVMQVSISPSSVPELAIGGSVGVMRFGGKDVSSIAGFTATASGLTVIPLLVTAQYTFESESNIKPYLQTGAGLYHLRTSGSSFNGFGVAPGGGILIPIKPNRTWFRVEGAFHVVKATYSIFNTTTSVVLAGGQVRFLQIQAGISTSFGG